MKIPKVPKIRLEISIQIGGDETVERDTDETGTHHYSTGFNTAREGRIGDIS